MTAASSGWRARAAQWLPWRLFFAVLAGLALTRGMTRAFVNRYEIMDGDFQNYNPVRRLLAGQVPYADFTVYLGAGELYGVGGLLLVLGNRFGRSMLAANALTWFFFELLAFAAACCALGSARRARALTLAVCAVCFALVQGLFGLGSLPGAGAVSTLLGYAAANGNSARMIRAGSLPLALLLAGAGLRRWYARRPDAGWTPRLGKAPAGGAEKAGWPAPVWLIPVLAGALVPWSNDMGAALYLALSLAFGLLLVRQYKTDWLQLAGQVGRYVLVSLAALGASVTLVSWGHPLAWLRQTRGAGSYQAWYYGSAEATKLTWLSGLRLDAAFWLCLALAVGAGVWLFAAGSRRDALSAAGCLVLTLGMALWNLLYCLLSASPVGPAGGAQALLVVLAPALVCRGALALRGRRGAQGRAAKPLAGPLCGVLAAAVLAVGLAGQIAARQAGRGADYTYVPALGGWLGDQAKALETEQSIAAGKTVWSTYGSALEAMTGRFQPSGTDYIIHVLGDRQRLAYLQQFQAGGYDLVETPSWKVSSFERWSRNANWWFYRELYRYWAPVGSTFACGGMHLFWRQTGADGALDASAAAAVTAESGAAVTLTVTAAPGFDGVADVALRYTFAAAPGYRLRGGVGSFLRAEAVTEKQLCEAAGRESENCDWFLPTDRGAYDIPVTLHDGVGVVRLTALPGDAAGVTVQDASVTALYTDWEYFYE